jgi:hypothetical protein
MSQHAVLGRIVEGELNEIATGQIAEERSQIIEQVKRGVVAGDEIDDLKKDFA